MADDELRGLKNLGEKRVKLLNDAGIFSFSDLAHYYPRAYRDLDDITPIVSATYGEPLIIEGRVLSDSVRRFFGRMCVTTAQIGDDTGTLNAVWYNQPWLQLRAGETHKFYGRVEYRRGVRQMTVPQLCAGHGIEPLYKRIAGIPDAALCEWIGVAVQRVAAETPEPLPDELRQRHGLCDLCEALTQIHHPDSRDKLAAARRYMAFEQLLTYQLALGSMRSRASGAVIKADRAALYREYIDKWPFEPTGAQRRVIDAVLSDLNADTAMARLVQGDVGCGKTAVAFAAIYAAVKAGWQCALMAPTEVLAHQHYDNALNDLVPLGVRCALLTGSVTGRARRDTLAALSSGECDLAIGTHALISEGVTYNRLGLVITDEQHRFGVRQRTMLTEKGDSPNTLVMSATPIPRTLALVLYGDLDVSVIDELPPGRTPVRTHLVPQNKVEDMYGFIRRHIAEGRQAYFVCPLVEESEELDALSAEELYERLTKGGLKGIKVELLHGRMRPAEKDAALERFRTGETRAIVSTTVIEVGVNVPNASIMVIVNAERFGLSQLHQLRGRVGRGAYESYCFLLGEPDERLRGFCSTNDGFEIARMDLEQRGAGELLGARQSGADSMFGSLLAAGADIIEATHQEARRLQSDDSPESRNLILEARRRFDKNALKYGLN